MTKVCSGADIHGMFLGSLAAMVRAIGASLGPQGRIVLFDLGGRVGRAASGVDIAREMFAAPGMRGLAPTILKEALVAFDREFGDGSARLALMSEAAFRAGSVMVAGGMDAGHLGAACMAFRADLAALIAAEAVEPGDTDLLAEQLGVAAGANLDLARLLAEACRDVGADGLVELTPSPRPGMWQKRCAGYIFDGVLSGRDAGSRPAVALENVHVIAADDSITDFGKLAPVIEGFAARKKSLLIVARDIGGTALAALEQNRRAGVLSVVAMTPADAGPRAAAIVEDLAIATGATLIAERSGQNLSGFKPHMLGQAQSLRMTGGRIELHGAAGDRAAIAARAAHLQGEIRAQRYLSLDREHVERRRARLLGQWIEIRLGGASEDETRTLLRTGRNALASIRSAALSGVVAGGGVALSRVAQKMAARGGDPIDRAAGRIVVAGLRSVELQLRRNAGDLPTTTDLPVADLTVAEVHPAVMIDADGCRIFDPLRLTQALMDQALSIAAQLLRIDTAVLR